jgi:hypothetical protein
VASTVGYGHFNVQTKLGKRFVMWFSLFGMWFFGNLVDSIVSIIAPVMLYAFNNLRLVTDAIVRKMKEGSQHLLSPQQRNRQMDQEGLPPARSKRMMSQLEFGSAHPMAGVGSEVTAAADGSNNAKATRRGSGIVLQSRCAGGKHWTCCVTNATLRKAFTVVMFGVLVFLSALLFFIIGARVFHIMALAEDKDSWVSLNDGVWFMFITSTTIGFGDMTPNFMQGPAVLVNMVLVVLGLAFVSEVMATFDHMFTATDELWFEIAVDKNHDGKLSADEISHLSGEEVIWANKVLVEKATPPPSHRSQVEPQIDQHDDITAAAGGAAAPCAPASAAAAAAAAAEGA